MKTNYSPKVVSVIAALSLALFSCSKDSIYPPANSSGNYQSVQQTGAVGSIYDLGFASSGSKIMYSTLVLQQYSVDSPETETSGGNASLALSFYSNSDGVIPEGTYTLASNTEQAPFTFDFTSLSTPTGQMSSTNGSPEIVSGTITISRNESNYTFSASLSFNTGNTFTGFSSGTMQYFDSEVAGKK